MNVPQTSSGGEFEDAVNQLFAVDIDPEDYSDDDEEADQDDD